MSTALPKSKLVTSIPKAISLAVTNFSFSKGIEPFKLTSFKVNVNDGKCLKNDRLASP